MNKPLFWLIIIAFIAWSAFSWRWYTCYIKGLCETSRQQNLPEVAIATEDIAIPKVKVPNPTPAEMVELAEPKPDFSPLDNSTPQPDSLKPELKTDECLPLLHQDIAYGSRNSYREVLALEEFLRTKRHETHLPDDGYYGRDDQAAVQRLQWEYKTEILDPWRLWYATGFVHTTTRKKINELHCSRN